MAVTAVTDDWSQDLRSTLKQSIEKRLWTTGLAVVEANFAHRLGVSSYFCPFWSLMNTIATRTVKLQYQHCQMSHTHSFTTTFIFPLCWFIFAIPGVDLVSVLACLCLTMPQAIHYNSLHTTVSVEQPQASGFITPAENNSDNFTQPHHDDVILW